MAERRYGFRFSFAEGCIIVVSLVGSSFLVFLFGIYAGRELEARKAAEHTSSVRLAVTGGGETANSVKEEQENPAAFLQPPTAATADKLKTVVVTPPRPLRTSSGSCSSSELFLNRSSRKNLNCKTNFSARTCKMSLENISQQKHQLTLLLLLLQSAVPEKKLTSLPAKESVAAMEPLKKAQTNAATLKASSTPSAALHGAVAEEKKQVEKEEPHPPLTKKPLPVPGRWSVQVQALRDEEGARQLVRRLQSQGYAPMISRIVRDGEVWYRVRVGSFASPRKHVLR